MNESHQPMTRRTIGLLSGLAVLSIGVFSAGLVLTYPNPDASGSEGRALSDTRLIDMSRTIANTGSNDRIYSKQPASTSSSAGSIQPTSQVSSYPSETQKNSVSDQNATISAPQNYGTSQSSSSAQQPTTQPASSGAHTASGPSVQTFVDDAVKQVTSLFSL